MFDRYQRKIEYVRISLTDRCNLRCRYCMPEEGVEKLRHEDILRFDEIVRIVRALASLGVRKVRLTGGEPLIRRNIVELVREIHAVPGIETIAMTTNGVMLADMAEDLVQAGLTGINISLDTLKAASFTELTRRPFFTRVEDGIEGLVHISKLDTKRVERVEDVVAVGDAIVVKVTDIDQQGRINLSRRDAILALEAKRAAQEQQ